MAGVKGSRRYDAGRRREHAKRTRLDILDAARRSFLEHGYAATSLPQVAAEVGVSPDTVYKAFRNKATLVKAVFDVAVAGDADPVPVLQRERAQRIRAEPDPHRKLEIYTEGLIATLGRAARIQLLVRAAADSDSDLEKVWADIQQSRLSGMASLAGNLAAGKRLAPGITVEEARDVLWAFASPELYRLLVLERGWAPDRYRRWVNRALVSALLPPG